ncbi:DUF6279 family lipoprotein [Halopseudomonas pelagia]|uniref:DUF6279 family lipoprotein n=1 Tax=Halopseudomonas pelagia TaxID=553151 RepID=UPI00117BD5EF|nr:DUF6279 family lipoprotein [Halopseudomonas pelagia]
MNWLISWKTGDYIPLTSTQKNWLSTRVDEHLDWHCSIEIPDYRSLLANLQTTLALDDLQASSLIDQIPQFEPAVDRVLLEIAPTMAELFQQLDDSQIAALEANLAEQHQEMHDKFVAPDSTTQAEERSERLEKRLRRWLGRLNESQRQRIESWSVEMEGQNRLWLDNRQHWQQQLLATLRSRSDPGFTAQITDLLIERERYWTTEFKEQTEINSRRGAAMLADVINLASDKQLTRMREQFATLDQDLQQMQCERPSTSA